MYLFAASPSASSTTKTHPYGLRAILPKRARTRTLSAVYAIYSAFVAEMALEGAQFVSAKVGTV